MIGNQLVWRHVVGFPRKRKCKRYQPLLPALSPPEVCNLFPPGHVACSVSLKKMFFFTFLPRKKFLAHRSPVCQWPPLVSFPSGPELQSSAEKKGFYLTMESLRMINLWGTYQGRRYVTAWIEKLTSSSSKRDSTQAHTQNHLKNCLDLTSLLDGEIPQNMLCEVRTLTS